MPPSITDMAQLAQNMKAMTTPFAESDRKVLHAQLEHILPLYCRMCGQCEGRCLKGLPVSDILRFLSYSEGYGEFQLGRESFLELPKAMQKVRCSLCPSGDVLIPSGRRRCLLLSRRVLLRGVRGCVCARAAQQIGPQSILCMRRREGDIGSAITPVSARRSRTRGGLQRPGAGAA